MSNQKGPIATSFFCRAFLLTNSFACAAVLALKISDRFESFSIQGAAAFIAISTSLVFALAYVAIRGRSSAVQRIAAELTALGFAILAVEVSIVLLTGDPEDTRALRQRAANKLGVNFDARYISEVVQDLQREGTDALPRIFGYWPQLPEVRAHLPPELYPLSHASSALVVECNESGYYHFYSTDEWGFNNPPGVVNAGNIDVALLGESYMLGHCLPSVQSLAGRIREKHPRTANFSKASNGSLLQLATFREYVEPLQPRIVVWAVNPHFVVPANELDDSLLIRYLEPTFSQNLRSRQSEIDELVRELALPVQIKLDHQAQLAANQSKVARLKRTWRLPETRAQISRALGASKRASDGVDLTVFRQTLQLAQQASERWGGQLVVVLLPIYAEVVADQISGNLRHDHLATVVSRMGIPVVDGVDLFKTHLDPKSLFTMRINNHPTPEGYALLADRVLAEIAAQYPKPPIARGNVTP